MCLWWHVPRSSKPGIWPESNAPGFKIDAQRFVRTYSNPHPDYNPGPLPQGYVVYCNQTVNKVLVLPTLAPIPTCTLARTTFIRGDLFLTAPPPPRDVPSSDSHLLSL